MRTIIQNGRYYMIYMVRILKDIHNHFGIYLNNEVGDIQATTQHKTIPKPPKFSSKTVGCSYMPCETCNPIPMLFPNYSSTASPLHATYNRAISVQFFPPSRWFLPPDSLANFADWVSWWSDTIHILCSLVVNLPILVVLPHILEEFSICSIYVEDLMAVGVEDVCEFTKTETEFTKFIIQPHKQRITHWLKELTFSIQKYDYITNKPLRIKPT